MMLARRDRWRCCLTGFLGAAQIHCCVRKGVLRKSQITDGTSCCEAVPLWRPLKGKGEQTKGATNGPRAAKLRPLIYSISVQFCDLPGRLVLMALLHHRITHTGMRSAQFQRLWEKSFRRTSVTVSLPGHNVNLTSTFVRLVSNKLCWCFRPENASSAADTSVVWILAVQRTRSSPAHLTLQSIHTHAGSHMRVLLWSAHGLLNQHQ